MTACVTDLYSSGVSDLWRSMVSSLLTSSCRFCLPVYQFSVGDSHAPRYRRGLYGDVTDYLCVVIEPSGCLTVIGADWKCLPLVLAYV